MSNDYQYEGYLEQKYEEILEDVKNLMKQRPLMNNEDTLHKIASERLKKFMEKNP